MTIRRLLPLLLVPALLLVEGFDVVKSSKDLPPPMQPPGERAAQDKLPQSKSPLWQRLARCDIHYDGKTGLYSVSIAPEVKAMNGSDVTIGGFVLPLDGQDNTRHFLLTKRTPVCMFCPPGAPNEVIEVKANHAVPWTDAMIKVHGRFTLVNNGEKAIFFALNGADKLP